MLEKGTLDIHIPLDVLKKMNISINEYLILLNINNNGEFNKIFNYTIDELIVLERKGYIKICSDGVFLRDKIKYIFKTADEDLFEKWLNIYPVRVSNGRGGSRSLSPAGANTILGKRLRKKWETTFRKDVEAQEKAIRVLELEIKDKEKSGSLMYMVDSHRWLNEGFFEKNEYLINDYEEKEDYEGEDYF